MSDEEGFYGRLNSMLDAFAVISLLFLVVFSYTMYQEYRTPPQFENTTYLGGFNVTEYYSYDGKLYQNIILDKSNGTLFIENKSGVVIIGSLFKGSNLVIKNCSNVRVHTTIFQDTDTAIYIINSRHVIVEKFAIWNVSYGIVLENSSDIILGGPSERNEEGDIIRFDSTIKNWSVSPIKTKGKNEYLIITGIDACND